MDSFNFLRFLQVSVNFLMFDTVDGRSHAPVDMVNICKYHQISYYLQGFIPSRKLTYHREVWKIIDSKVPLKGGNPVSSRVPGASKRCLGTGFLPTNNSRSTVKFTWGDSTSLETDSFHASFQAGFCRDFRWGNLRKSMEIRKNPASIHHSPIFFWVESASS